MVIVMVEGKIPRGAAWKAAEKFNRINSLIATRVGGNEQGGFYVDAEETNGETEVTVVFNGTKYHVPLYQEAVLEV